MFEKDLALSALYDLYAPLLSQKKREAFEGYYSEDLSLAELSELTGTSRQAVRDLVFRTTAELNEYEKALHLSAKQKEIDALCESALAAHQNGDSRGLETLLERIKIIFQGG